MSRAGASRGLQESIRGCVDALDVPALGPVLGAGRGGGLPPPSEPPEPLPSTVLCLPLSAWCVVQLEKQNLFSLFLPGHVLGQ